MGRQTYHDHIQCTYIVGLLLFFLVQHKSSISQSILNLLYTFPSQMLYSTKSSPHIVCTNTQKKEEVYSFSCTQKSLSCVFGSRTGFFLPIFFTMMVRLFVIPNRTTYGLYAVLSIWTEWLPKAHLHYCILWYISKHTKRYR